VPDIPKILIVEDQYFVATDCERHLTNAGFKCVGLASDASSALELANKHKPDLVLLDIRLANNGDGVEVAITMHRSLGIRAIFASAHIDAQVRDRAATAMPLGWLEKPYTPQSLLLAVNGALAELRSCGDRSETESTPRRVH
jgi:two-component system, response regulator PdtaR